MLSHRLVSFARELDRLGSKPFTTLSAAKERKLSKASDMACPKICQGGRYKSCVVRRTEPDISSAKEHVTADSDAQHRQLQV